MTADRVAALRDDILAGPGALADLLDSYAAPDGPLAAFGQRPGRVAFSGLGSSRYAALTAAAQLRAGGVPAWAEYASTGTPAPPADDLTLVAVSASGRTREVVEAARRHRGRSTVIAVTNDPDSPVAAATDHVLPLLAGREGSGIATRTFRATVAVLGLIAGRWLGGPTAEDLRPSVHDLQAALDGREAWLPAAAGLLDGAAAIDVIGDASDAALVQQAALMLREGPRLPAVAHDTGDWLHTAVYLALPGQRALLFSGAASDDEVVATIRRRGGQTVVVGHPIEGAALTIESPVGGGSVERAIVGSVVSELLAVELWDRATAEDVPLG